MPTVGVTELLIVLLIVLFIFGAGKLPSISRGIAKSVRDFRAAVGEGGQGGESGKS